MFDSPQVEGYSKQAGVIDVERWDLCETDFVKKTTKVESGFLSQVIH